MQDFIKYIFIVIPICVLSQNKKIYLFDKSNKPINKFEVKIYSKNRTINIKNNSTNFFLIKERYDSIKINYDLFYTKKIANRNFKLKDTLILNNVVSLKEISLNSKNNSLEIGTKGKNRRFFVSNNMQYINRFNVSNYNTFYIDYVKFFAFEKFKNKMALKNYFTSNNKKIELILMLSNNKNPEINSKNILQKPFIIKLENIHKKQWIKIKLQDLDLQIKDYKYLFVGFKIIENTIVIGICKNKKNKNVSTFSKSISAFEWQHLKWHNANYTPAIKIGLKE